jgi:hypothetical protein
MLTDLPPSLITMSSKQPMMHAKITNNLMDSKGTHLSVHIDCHTRKHCTWFDYEDAYLVSSGLNFRFQISSSTAAIAFSCHVTMWIFSYWKILGSSPRNENHNLQILVWFGRSYEPDHVPHSPLFNDNRMLLRDMLLIFSNVLLICIHYHLRS